MDTLLAFFHPRTTLELYVFVAAVLIFMIVAFGTIANIRRQAWEEKRRLEQIFANQVAEYRAELKHCVMDELSVDNLRLFLYGDERDQPRYNKLAQLKVDRLTKTMSPEAIKGRTLVLNGTKPPPRECSIDRSGWEEGDSDERRGLSWTSAEHDALLDGFHGGLDGDQLAEQHRRTAGAIAAQLEKLGLIKRHGYNRYLTPDGTEWYDRRYKD